MKKQQPPSWLLLEQSEWYHAPIVQQHRIRALKQQNIHFHSVLTLYLYMYIACGQEIK